MTRALGLRVGGCGGTFQIFETPPLHSANNHMQKQKVLTLVILEVRLACGLNPAGGGGCCCCTPMPLCNGVMDAEGELIPTAFPVTVLIAE